MLVLENHGNCCFTVGLLCYHELVCLVLALSMLDVMLGCLIGMSLPFVLNRMGMDPASASAPLVTSICDATGVLVYYLTIADLINITLLIFI